MSDKETAIDLLKEIRSILADIRTDIRARTVVPKPKGKARRRGAINDAMATVEENHAAERVVALWAEVCPDLPQPVAGLDAQRRRQCKELWDDLGGETGVKDLFQLIAVNDWLCGRRCKQPNGSTGQRFRAYCLWDAIRNRRDVVEGNAR